MNRITAIIALLMLPLAAYCGDKDKKKPKPMSVSRWREVKRMSLDSTVSPFFDTLFVAFRRNDSFTYYNKDGFIYYGKYTINEDSLLDFGTNRYQVRQRRPLSLILSDAQGIYFMLRDSSDTAKLIVLDKEEKLLPVTNTDQMIGRWQVYKRTSDEPVSALDNENQVRSVYITGPTTDGHQGYVFSSKDMTNAPSWFVTNYTTDQVLETDGKSKRLFRVVKCQKGELILDEGGIRYYLKQFK